MEHCAYLPQVLAMSLGPNLEGLMGQQIFGARAYKYILGQWNGEQGVRIGIPSIEEQEGGGGGFANCSILVVTFVSPQS